MIKFVKHTSRCRASDCHTDISYAVSPLQDGLRISKNGSRSRLVFVDGFLFSHVHRACACCSNIGFVYIALLEIKIYAPPSSTLISLAPSHSASVISIQEGATHRLAFVRPIRLSCFLCYPWNSDGAIIAGPTSTSGGQMNGECT